MNELEIGILAPALLIGIFGLGTVLGLFKKDSPEASEMKQASGGAIKFFFVLLAIALTIIYILPMVPVPGE